MGGMLPGMSKVFIFQLLFLASFAGGSPVSGEGTSRISFMGIVLFSAVLLISLVIILLVCLEGSGCWPLRYFRRDAVAAAGIDNPLADSGGAGMGLSEIDVRGLELDPIVFEPLPTLSDLTPGRRDGEDYHHMQYHLNGKHFGSIVPFSSPESHIFAHDWFDEPFRNFPRGNIEYIRELGKGWFGQVIEGEARDIVPYAKKMRIIVKVLRGDASDSEQMRFLDESRLYRDGNHGNILKLLGHSIETNPFLLLLEYCALGDLKSYLISNVSRAEVLNYRGVILRMALDIAKGLEWMAASDFTHGDLAARNCQVGSEGRILIGDYGLSTQNFKDDYYWSSNIAIPLRWAAPETLHCTINTIQTLRVTKESNVWTFGIVLWEIAEFGKLPYFELSDEQVISRVLCDRNYCVGVPTMPSLVLSDEIYSLMTACWSYDPSKRPPIPSIVQRLQLLIHRLESLSLKKSDDFETKWEHALVSQTKKKSVSFSGEPSETPLLPTVNFAISTPATPITVEAPSQPFAKTMIQFESREDAFPSLELWKPPDPEEEDYKKRIERGEITQKVREKSESVQDLMILTHVEPGDLSDGESLVIIEPPPGVLRRASSETAINSPGKASSHAPKITNSFLRQPDLLGNGNCPSPLNRTGINFQLTAPTPSPGIKINVIQPTPIPAKRETSPERENKSEAPVQNHHIKRRFVFRDDEREFLPASAQGFQVVRHASTPFKSPQSLNDSSHSGDSDVFNNCNSPEPVNEKKDKTCEISPISQAASVNNSIHSTAIIGDTNSYTVSVFGAVDDLGLNPFQGVTTTVAIPPSPPSASPEGNRSVISKKLAFDNDISVGDQDPSVSVPESWLVYTKGEGKEDADTFIAKKPTVKPPQSPIAYDVNDSNFKTQGTSSSKTVPVPEIPIFKLDTLKANFTEEITEVNEELGSLILHDLDKDEPEYKLIKEDIEGLNDEDGLLVTSRLTRNAFGGEVGEESLSLSPTVSDENVEPVPFVPSKWNSTLNPAKSAIKSPETFREEVKEPSASSVGTGIRKSVSFERKKRQFVYEYPPHQVHTDSDEEDAGNAASLSGPLALSLDWELNPDEMEGVIEDDWDLEVGEPKASNKMDVYRISPFAFHSTDGEGTGIAEMDAPGLGGLRHTRDKLTLDLGKHSTSGGSNVSTNNDPLPSSSTLADSGVGSSANLSPILSHCDNNQATDPDQTKI